MRKALVVGIDDYPDAPLQFCNDDAKGVAELFQLPEYGFEVDCLLNSDATRKRIRAALDDAFASHPQVLVFYFAGHGTATDLGGFLDTIDAETADDGLALELLRRYAEVRLEQGSSLVYILDCCHAGIAAVRKRGTITASLRGDDIRYQMAALGGSGRLVLGACQEHELSYEHAQHGHGIFTYYLLEGLSGYAADPEGEVTALIIVSTNTSREVSRKTDGNAQSSVEISPDGSFSDQASPQLQDQPPTFGR